MCLTCPSSAVVSRARRVLGRVAAGLLRGTELVVTAREFTLGGEWDFPTGSDNP